MTEVRSGVPPLVWWLLVAFLALVVGSLAYGLNHYDDDLTRRADEALRTAGIPVSVHVDGRDAYLTGSLEFEGDVAAAVEAVRSVRGIRKVSSEIRFSVAGARPVPPGVLDTPPPSTSPELTVRVQDGVATLQGRVPDVATRQAIYDAAAAVYPTVIDRLEVVTDLQSPAWLAALPRLIPQYAEVGEWSLSFGSEGAGLSGIVPDEATRTDLGDATAAELGGLAFANRLQVVTPVGASLVAVSQEATIELRGIVPDRATADAIVAAVQSAAGDMTIVDELEAAAGVGDVAWLPVLPDLLAATSRLDPWSLEIGEDAIVVSGRGASATVVSDATATLTAISGFTIDTSGVEVAAEAVAEELTRLLAGGTTFASGSVALSETAAALLDEAARLLIANPSTVLVVEGHTDDQGDAAANLALSQARAEAVVAYLVAAGVEPVRLTAVGFGESRPVASNDTADGRAQNRRIDFVLEVEAG